MPAAEIQRRITIKDVARSAGVHFTTVSLALREHPSIPPATRDRIREAARQLGYSPNPVFAALTHFRVHGRVRATPPRIGYIVNHPVEKYRHGSAFLAGARQQASMLGYDIELLTVSEGHHDSASISRYLDAQKIEGIILASFEPGQPGIDLDWASHAVVKINSLHVGPPTTCVSNDQRQDVRLAFREMLLRGYHRIGLAVGLGDEESTQYRHNAGYLIEQSTVAVGARIPALLFPHRATDEEASALLDEWISRNRVDAVLCNWSNIDALLRATGRRVPEDLGCACLCLPSRDTGMAGVFPNLQMVGAKAVSLLTSQLKLGTRGVPEFASSTYVRSSWVDGASAPDRKGGAS